MIDKAIEYVISFLKRFLFYITNLLIIMIYFVSLEPISSGLKSYSENGQHFYSFNLVDVYPWSILIILVLAALPLLIHLKTKNNLDSKFFFFQMFSFITYYIIYYKIPFIIISFNHFTIQ